MDRITVELLHSTPVHVLQKALATPYANESAGISRHPCKVAKRIGVYRKHGSILEHITLNFYVSGFSRLVLQEMSRHRLASPTVESTRWCLRKLVQAENPSLGFLKQLFVFPPFTDKEMLDDYIEFTWQNYQSLRIVLDSWANDYVKYLLPEGFRTSEVLTINMRSLRNFLELRAQRTEFTNPHFEISGVAQLMGQLVLQKTPYGELVEDLLPDSRSGGVWKKITIEDNQESRPVATGTCW